MSIERDRRVFEIVRAALEVEGAAREALIREQCGGDAGLESDVVSLLARASAGAEPVPGQAVARSLLGVLREVAPDAEEGSPRRIGRFVVLHEIGRGGMGVVYEATQENPRRSVAIKVLHPLLSSPAAVRRLEREAQILARLQHPGIAQVFEAGSFEGGFGLQPYLAMELVDGGDLWSFVQARSLDARGKVELCVLVCDAVGHAHERGVVHRDLKPGNVLVDAEGRPKVLDFGIARSIEAEAQRATLTRESGSIVGTLAYMSPEQVEGDADDIDARSDVYALGAVLYELLTGRLPNLVDGMSIAQAIRAIRDDEPPAPGTFERAARGDLGIIIGKALSKDRTRRYANAREMAADLRRWLSDEPIVARRPSTVYRMAKYARRNRGLVAGVVIAFLALVIGLAISIAKTMESARETRRLRNVNTFFVQRMLQAPDPGGMGRDVKVVQLLDRARKEVDATFGDDPEIRAETLHTLGTAYQKLQLPADAVELLQKAFDLRVEVLGARAPETIETKLGLARALLGVGRTSESLKLFDELEHADARAPIASVSFGSATELALDARMGRAEALRDMGRHEDALVLARSTLSDAETKTGPMHAVTLRAVTLLCYFRRDAGDLDEAEKLALRCLDITRALRGNEHPETLRAEAALANLRIDQGRPEGEEMLRRSLADHERVFGADAANTSDVVVSLASFLDGTGRHEEAEKLYRRALASYVAQFGPEHRTSLTVENSLAVLYRKTGRLDEAAALAARVLEGRKRVLGPEHREVGATLNTLGAIHVLQKQWSAAETELQEALRIGIAALGESHPQVGTARYNLAELQRKMGQFASAERNFRDLLAVDERSAGPESQDALSDRLRVAQCVQAQGRDAEAEQLARDLLATRRRVSGEQHAGTLLCRSLLGRALLAQGKLDEAEEHLQEALRVLEGAGRKDLLAEEDLRGRLDELRRRRAAAPDAATSGSTAPEASAPRR